MFLPDVNFFLFGGDVYPLLDCYSLLFPDYWTSIFIVMILCPQTFDAALVKTLENEKLNNDYSSLYQDDKGELLLCHEPADKRR